MLIFTESQSVYHSPKAEPEPEHKKKNVKKAMTVLIQVNFLVLIFINLF